MRHVLQVFAEKFVKTPKHGYLLERLDFLAKSIIFPVFSRNEATFATFCRKVRQNAKTRRFVRKVESSGQINDFSSFFTK